MLKILNIKSIFQILAIAAVLLLFGVTATFTYKAYIEMIDFINIGEESTDYFSRHPFSYAISLFVAVATAVQSSPVIWSRLSYWGQYLDNKLLYLIKKKKYFLDEASEKIREVEKTINNMHRKIQEYVWNSIQDENFMENKSVNKEIANLINNEIRKSIDECNKIIKILKSDEAKDSINKQRQCDAEKSISDLIVKITDILKNFREIKK